MTPADRLPESAAQLRQHITDCFAATRIPDDVPTAAAAAMDPAVLAAWFKTPFRPAAVFIGLTERQGELHLMLTERTHTVRDHPGQIAFPGGVAEACDADLLATALRESEEEVGLRAAQTTVVGYLAAQPIITGYAVLPVVGFYDPAFEAAVDPREVAGVFEVPLNFLLDDNNRRPVDRERAGITLKMYEFHYDGHRIWGATALMIGQFIAHLRGEADNPLGRK
jgi:8-oxo-dGTP pyrophosphatase MutT (NUDIX family)